MQALPALAAVRGSWPGAHVTLLTDAALAGFVAPLGLVDATVGFDVSVAYHGNPTARATLLLRLARAARGARPEVAITLKAAPVYALLARASGAPVRAGLARGAGARLLTHPVPVDARQHREARYRDAVRAGSADPDAGIAVPWPETELALPRGPGRPTRWLAVAPGGGRNAKETMASRRWAPARFAVVAAEALATDPALGVLLLGGPGDAAEAGVVAAALPGGRVHDLVGHTDLFGARAAIARSAAFLGNDSALMHLAATTQTPIVAVFGPTDPRVAAPRRANVHAIWSPVSPAPCVDDASGQHRACETPCCIERVTAARVGAAVRHALESSSAARAVGHPG